MLMNGVVDAVEVVGLMALSFRTAPWSRGLEALVIRPLARDNLRALAGEMSHLENSSGQSLFVRDAGNVERRGRGPVLGVAGGLPDGSWHTGERFGQEHILRQEFLDERVNTWRR